MTSPARRPLDGLSVGVTAQRRREELGDALARQGAEVVYGPAIRTVPLADDTDLLDATRRLIENPPDITVTTTAVGFRGWLDVADAWGLREPLLDALRRSDVVTRGPKVRGAVRAAGLREVWSPESESSDEVFAHLAGHYDLSASRLAVQLHGDPLTDLLNGARAVGARIDEISVYRWEQPDDDAPLRRLIGLAATGGVDAVTFTSAPAAINFLATAGVLGLEPQLTAALGRSVACFAVGPVTGAPLVAAGIPVISPERFRLGALVREVTGQLPAFVASSVGRAT